MLCAQEALQVISETPHNSPKYQSGSYARFLRINEQWGIKLFDRKHYRDKSYDAQEKAYRLDLGPHLGDKLELRLNDGEAIYGYVTECIVETYQDRFARETYGYLSGPDMTCDEDLHCDSEMENDSEYIDLMGRLGEADFCTYDMHSQNVGWMKDGRLVCIDFSHV